MLLILIALVILTTQLVSTDSTSDEPRPERDVAAQSSLDAATPETTTKANPCSLATPGSAIGIALGGCRTLISDVSAKSDPLSVWGEVDCQEDSRVGRPTSGGDTHPRGDGAPQSDDSFRRMTVINGDDVDGERCELGQNDRAGPTAVYHEGERRVTFISVRLPRDFPLGMDVFQVVMQMKQAQPSDNGGGTPVLALEAFDERWRLRQSDSTGPTSDAHELWSAPAQTDAWTRFAFDVTYSQDPSRGRLKVYVDLNGDSDFGDSGEQSATFQTYTLKVETADGGDGIEAGESIPSHLRAGIYHNPDYPCPGPAGCHVDVDNVQVVGP